MNAVIPRLWDTNSCLDDKFQMLLQSQQEFLLGSLQGGIEDFNKTENSANTDALFVNNDHCLDNPDGFSNKTTSSEEGLGVEFKASSFFSGDDHDVVLDRPSKKPRHELPDEDLLKEQRRMICRSVLGQLGHDSIENHSFLPSDYMTSRVPSSVQSKLQSKAQIERISIGVLNQSLLHPAPRLGNVTSSAGVGWEPLSLFREPCQTIVIGEHIISFESAIRKSQRSQKNIEEWDKKMGLKSSHSRTMSMSSKSRKRVLALLNEK